MAETERRPGRTQTKPVKKGPYIQTETGNIISRKSRLEGTPHIVLSGRVVLQPGAVLRGDLAPPIDPSKPTAPRTSISIGKYTYVAHGAEIHPPSRVLPSSGELVNIPLRIGEHVHIGERSKISAASIGSYVYIGEDVTVGNACIIADRVKVLDGAVLSAAMQVPSGMVVGGKPARILGEVGDGWGVGSGTVEEGEWIEGGDLKELIRSVK
jgi:dynactin-5